MPRALVNVHIAARWLLDEEGVAGVEGPGSPWQYKGGNSLLIKCCWLFGIPGWSLHMLMEATGGLRADLQPPVGLNRGYDALSPKQNPNQCRVWGVWGGCWLKQWMPRPAPPPNPVRPACPHGHAGVACGLSVGWP